MQLFWPFHDKIGRRPDPPKVASINGMHRQTEWNCNYLPVFWTFILNMHDSRDPLNTLLKRDSKWCWPGQCQSSLTGVDIQLDTKARGPLNRGYRLLQTWHWSSGAPQISLPTDESVKTIFNLDTHCWFVTYPGFHSAGIDNACVHTDAWTSCTRIRGKPHSFIPDHSTRRSVINDWMARWCLPPSPASQWRLKCVEFRSRPNVVDLSMKWVDVDNRTELLVCLQLHFFAQADPTLSLDVRGMPRLPRRLDIGKH